jgi:hypothetical protein
MEGARICHVPMAGFFIIPILGEHVEDQLRTPGRPPADEAEEDAFDHEASDKPQPYFPANKPDSGKQQS